VPTPVLPPILVRPHLFHLEFAGVVGLSDEVAHAAWVELAALAEPGTYRETAIAVRGRRGRFPAITSPRGSCGG
jgi:creatinine amidohydrolase/Fe(II)-dependent formamide hydrolase-like protein